MSVTCECGCCRGQKRALDHVELESQEVVNCRTGTGHWTWIPYKSNRHFSLLSHLSLSSPWVSCNDTDPLSTLIYYFCLKLFTISNTLCKLTMNLFRLFSPTFCVSMCVLHVCVCMFLPVCCLCMRMFLPVCAHACEGQRSMSENCPQLLFHLVHWGRVSRTQWFG